MEIDEIFNMTNKPEYQSIDKIKKVFSCHTRFPVPKGEVWMGTDFLAQAGLSDTLDNHSRLAHELGMDLICLPVADDARYQPVLGYRYFKPSDIRTAVRSGHHLVVAVVDGPLQKQVSHAGLMETLTSWIRDRKKFMEAYTAEQEKILAMVDQCLEMGAHALVITDDMASEQGTMISPGDIDIMCTGFYTRAVEMVHEAGRHILLHSCGKITGLLPLLDSWKIDGLAAVQHRPNNLVELQHKLPGRIIMAGIDANLLEQKSLVGMEDDFLKIIALLKHSGGLVLCSACGLYKGYHIDRIKKIYALADSISASAAAPFKTGF
ncbi:MAG: hypothetical protein A2097_08130 [Desulfobacula sp. GWF2_41_7]|nr:MAG: hypothetical protein A2097_08130 [Desulfobacula sp. GWF2_41_7]